MAALKVMCRSATDGQVDDLKVPLLIKHGFCQQVFALLLFCSGVAQDVMSEHMLRSSTGTFRMAPEVSLFFTINISRAQLMFK